MQSQYSVVDFHAARPPTQNARLPSFHIVHDTSISCISVFNTVKFTAIKHVTMGCIVQNGVQSDSCYWHT